MKRKVLVIVDYYLPGYKGGGPIASVSRIVDTLKDDYEFYILTRDRDLNDTSPYPTTKTDCWTPCTGGFVYYCSPKELSLGGFKKAINEVQPDVIYLNSYFSLTTRMALFLRQFGFIKCPRWVVAPRGEFYAGARSIKPFKKNIFVAAMRHWGLYNNLVWHASTNDEADLVKTTIGQNAKLIIVVDPIGPKPIESQSFVPMEKPAGKASLCWVSRIAPSKNLEFAIRSLIDVQGEVEFSIYGPIEDPDYWSKCVEIINGLPRNISVTYKGSLLREQVTQEMSKHHFFLFPTLGENYGHVIAEALSVGRPILLSDQTPWSDLSATGAGWILPLSDPTLWRQEVSRCIAMGQSDYAKHSRAALKHFHSVQSAASPDRNREIFEPEAA